MPRKVGRPRKRKVKGAQVADVRATESGASVQGEITYKRGVSDSTITSDRMTWESRCGNFRVQRLVSKYDAQERFYALVKRDEQWCMLVPQKHYRTRQAAESALSASVSPTPLKQEDKTQRTVKKRKTSSHVAKNASKKSKNTGKKTGDNTSV